MLSIHSRGQSVTEYLLVFGVVAAAITGMMVYAKRGLQAGLKAAADDMRPMPDTPEQAQIDGMRQETGDTREPGETVVVGLSIAKDSSSTTNQQSDTNMGAVAGGGHFTTTADNSTTQGTSSSKVVAEIK